MCHALSHQERLWGVFRAARDAEAADAALAIAAAASYSASGLSKLQQAIDKVNPDCVVSGCAATTCAMVRQQLKLSERPQLGQRLMICFFKTVCSQLPSCV